MIIKPCSTCVHDSRWNGRMKLNDREQHCMQWQCNLITWYKYSTYSTRLELHTDMTFDFHEYDVK
jgi:hypothetical protein